MKVLRKLTLRTLFMNKKRTIVTIVGIMLATALITCVANMAESLRASMIAYEKAASGDYHYAFYGVSQENRKYFENNRNIQSLGYDAAVGYAMLEGSTNPDKPYLYLRAMDEAGMRGAGVPSRLLEGRLPENEHELLISKHIQTNGGVKYQIGDHLTLEIGQRVLSDGSILTQGNPFLYEEESFVPQQSVEYTIVGIMERPSLSEESTNSPGYMVVTYLSDKNKPETMNLYATYTKTALRNRDQVTASLLGVSDELYQRYRYGTGGDELTAEEFEKLEAVASWHEINVWLLKWELMLFSDGTKGMLYSMAAVAILIIIVTGVFCIRNSFVISLTEKMKLYGMLSSVGATKKQRKQLVHGEAVLLGCIGIPLGILCGVLATYLVVRFTSGLMTMGLGIQLIFAFSVPAMVVGVLLSMVTVYFSAGQAARRASKVSPISAIRGNEMIKIQAKEIRTPKLFHRLFGIGGAIAYKNLRRARVKYRTTVISIVVSVAVFIAMTTFIQLGFRATNIYYKDIPYQIAVTISEYENPDDVSWIRNLDGIRQYELQTRGAILVNPAELAYTDRYLELHPYLMEMEEADIKLVAIGSDNYEEYCRKLGLSPEEVKDKGILIADYSEVMEDGKRAEGMMFEHHPGDVIHGKAEAEQYASNEEAGEEQEYENIDIELAAQTDVRPMSLHHEGGQILIMSNEWFEEHEALRHENSYLFIQCDDADSIQKEVEDYLDMNATSYYLYNVQEEQESNQSLYTLISVFLYGFIIVIALIGITNIFNTITTNMELRSREFAMLKSIGMTRKEFRRLVSLESLFYGVKSLLIGIPVGIVLSLCFYAAFSRQIETAYQLPYSGIVISILAVLLLLFVITRYSMGRINRKNIVETIQSENI
ncbi:MAG: ABC transporter permease [Clostridium sp.]|nr:ABC transporter permease [Clostridium sp.]MCM1550964.1 ABC transporter permease [Clostridium sp.]